MGAGPSDTGMCKIPKERLEDTMGQIRCNKCGREIQLGEGKIKEDCLKVVKEWGYFSEKDREQHTFYLCEECYDNMVKEFVLPIKKEFLEEVL